jgi:hypothetical protein
VKTIERALMTKELSKAQAALWSAFSIAAAANQLDVAKALRGQYKAIAATIVELNGGPVLALKEMIR